MQEFPVSIPSKKAEIISLKDWKKAHSLPEDEVPKFNGPLSREMWKKVQSLNSRMPDDFDWSVYDKLHDRFGDKQPRGGILLKTNLKLVNHHSTCTKCHYSFELDAYGRGCVHNCVYCYAKEALTQHGYWNRPFPFPVDVSELRKIFFTVFETDKRSKWRAVLEKKIPLRLGSMSDSFMHLDKKYGVTREILKILKFYQYPYVIFTRSDLIADDIYLNLLDPSLAAVQFSISGLDEKITRALEPGAPSVEKRLKALKLLSQAGIWTGVRINPLFPTYPDGYFSNPEIVVKKFGSLSSVPKFNLLDIENTKEFVDRLKDANVPSVLAGFVRLSRFAYSAIHAAAGVDLKSFFRYDIAQDGRDKRYSDQEISHYYKKLKFDLTRRGIRFSTCYIGNGAKDYFQYQNLWSNKKDCCDVIGNVPSFNSSSQQISWEERLKHTSHTESALKAMAIDQGENDSGYSFAEIKFKAERNEDGKQNIVVT